MKTPNYESILRRGSLVLALFACGAAMSAACAVDSHVVLADDPDAAQPETPSFQTPAEAGADANDATTALMCEGTECPSPYATCGTTASLHCGTNLLTDAENCGACGNVCPAPNKQTVPRCSNGKCVFDCKYIVGWCSRVDYKDCNSNPEDGCETTVSDDPLNCGGCGNVCPAGQGCYQGVCGCPAGKTFCPACKADACVDTTNDDNNCGGCYNSCPTSPDDGCSVKPKDTFYGCSNSQCGALKCKGGTADCNGDIPKKGCLSDGCEVDFATRDPKNCGACGNECKPDEECRADGNNGLQCLKKCADSGRTRCEKGCADLLSDPENCGDCEMRCPSFGNDKAACRKGVCVTECADGFGDCDGNPLNGCEARLDNNPLHCGACGVTCNYGAGQPCIEGKCLMVECDGGGQTK
ncbi:Tryptophan synthase alpha chain [Labilithrix luteola]|uniref:Tryptophan synthase alpha chain n=1 Tax=Labilithrix luteola TaxID=1391654 RepID=A0A0K1PP59_9BACT|nr:hypothetical protein [Labilithrix luteola]AKU94904.1 Tryptophan synthase alpha chain [Labilithrix luteola]